MLNSVPATELAMRVDFSMNWSFCDDKIMQTTQIFKNSFSVSSVMTFIQVAADYFSGFLNSFEDHISSCKLKKYFLILYIQQLNHSQVYINV